MARGRNAGNKGQGSKWISRKTRHRIYARDGWRCVWCGVSVEPLGPDEDRTNAHTVQPTLDHVIPRSQGGSNIPSNLVTCCMGCNRNRCDRSVDLWALAVVWGEPAAGDTHTGSVVLRALKAVCSPLPPAA